MLVSTASIKNRQAAHRGPPGRFGLKTSRRGSLSAHPGDHPEHNSLQRAHQNDQGRAGRSRLQGQSLRPEPLSLWWQQPGHTIAIRRRGLSARLTDPALLTRWVARRRGSRHCAGSTTDRPTIGWKADCKTCRKTDRKNSRSILPPSCDAQCAPLPRWCRQRSPRQDTVFRRSCCSPAT